MSNDTGREVWDEELGDLFGGIESGFSSENRWAQPVKDGRKIQRVNRRGLDQLATIDPKNRDPRHDAMYRDSVRQSLWGSLLCGMVVVRRNKELVEKSGRVLAPEAVDAALLRLLGVRAKAVVKARKKGE